MNYPPAKHWDIKIMIIPMNGQPADSSLSFEFFATNPTRNIPETINIRAII